LVNAGSSASSAIGNGTKGLHFERPPVLIPRSCTSRPSASCMRPTASSSSRPLSTTTAAIGLSHEPGSAGAPVVGVPVVGAPVVGAPVVGAPVVPVPLVPVDASLAPDPASAPPQPNAVTTADKTSA